MLYRDICRTLSFYLWILLLPLSIPLCMAIYCEWIAGPSRYPQPPAAIALLMTMAFTAILGAILKLIGQKSSGQLFRREALLLVLMVYFLTPVISALPFYLNGTLANPIDALFEAVSGLTTTGATIMEAKNIDPATGRDLPIKKTIVTGQPTTYTYYGTIQPVIDPQTKQVLYTGLEAVSPALIFWRSLMQWLGGVGIIVLFVAILPALGVGGKVLFQTEITGPSKETMLPRIKETASQVWKIYLGLTLLEVLLLVATNSRMPLFDAITISLSTLSTGGFVPNNGGIPAYNSVYTDAIIIIFMIFGSINFSIYFFCMRGKFSKLKDSELRVFLLIILFSIFLATWQLIGTPKELLYANEPSGLFTFKESLRHGAFQVISAQTSTGFATLNFDAWPFAVQVLMLMLLLIGGMAGSTAGGIKIIRLQTCLKVLIYKIESIYRPDAVRTYRLGNTIIEDRAATSVLCFFMVITMLTVLGTFLFVLDHIDPETSLTTVGCMISNGGFAFRMGGPNETFAFLSDFSKILSFLWMIAGRLEYFAVLIIFLPAFWKTTY